MWRRVILMMAATAGPAAADDAVESAFRGRRIAEANCAECHAITQIDESPLKEAPPFREIPARIPADALAKMLEGAVFKKHAVMPDFEPDPQQAADLVTFMHDIAGSQ
ncbi:c-type cytochrome [Aminobacter sp. J44]|uniref:c-type cytochrome n=1 Tax=Aminobacter sp. J44 TaxID=935262 RepID=UPI001199C1AF|nr:c-type cytochrome [Aminobacter sp. J44]TWG55170.1 cytochrome c [Aminobacter sp. J44]